jgi:hypothetical protein
MTVMTATPTPRVPFAYHLINPKNAPYVERRSSYISSNTDWLIVFGGLGLWIMFVLLSLAQILAIIEAVVTGDEMRARIPILLIELAVVVFFTYMILPSTRDILRERRLARQGQILPGMATSFERRGDALRVGYRFQTPDGRELNGITGTLYFPEARPKPHQQLVILYLNDKNHKAL